MTVQNALPIMHTSNNKKKKVRMKNITPGNRNCIWIKDFGLILALLNK